MLCSRPFRPGGHAEFGCGQCMPCRLNKKRMWVSRLMLESFQHEASFFVTLTYRDEELPCDGSVSLRDVQLFFKRLREAVRTVNPALRYYCAAEYGDVYGRPHYHAVLFGSLGNESHQNPMRGMKYAGCSCVICRSWSKGTCFIGTVTPHSVAYVVSYLTKGRLKDGSRKSEFSVMSRRPGIGACPDVISEFASAMVDKETGELRLEDGDVKSVWRYNKRLYPLGRLLREKLRSKLFGETKAPESAMAMREEVAEVERLTVGHREWSRVKGFRRVKSEHRADAVVKLSRERKGYEAV